MSQNQNYSNYEVQEDGVRIDNEQTANKGDIVTLEFHVAQALGEKVKIVRDPAAINDSEEKTDGSYPTVDESQKVAENKPEEVEKSNGDIVAEDKPVEEGTSTEGVIEPSEEESKV